MPWAGHIPNDSVSLVLDSVLQMSHALFIFSFWHSFHFSLISCSQHPIWDCYNLVQCWILSSLSLPAGKAISNAVFVPKVPSSSNFCWQRNASWVTLMAKNVFVVWVFVCLGFYVCFFLKKNLLKPMEKVAKGLIPLFHMSVLMPKLSTVRWSIPHRSTKQALHLRLFAWWFWCVIFYEGSGWLCQDKCQDLIIISFGNICIKLHRSSDTIFLTLYFFWDLRVHKTICQK